MSTLKRLLKNDGTLKFLCWLMSLYIRLVYVTNRKQFVWHPETEPYMRGEKNAIYTFWHGRMVMIPPLCPPKRKMRVLISLHRDGIMISRIISHFNQATVSGSSSKGGKEAVREMLNALNAGDNMSITPDGPRGPAQIVSKGTITVARLSEKPIIPVTFAASRGKHLRSWDRFLLAYPFGRIIFCTGAPIPIPREMKEGEEEETRLKVEQAMNALVDKAESILHG